MMCCRKEGEGKGYGNAGSVPCTAPCPKASKLMPIHLKEPGRWQELLSSRHVRAHPHNQMPIRHLAELKLSSS